VKHPSRHGLSGATKATNLKLHSHYYILPTTPTSARPCFRLLPSAPAISATMRLSANILQSAEQRTNPLGEREILLRSLAIPAIEHLAVTRDQFDVVDMSNNHLCRLENFPRLERLSCLYLGGNGIDYVDGKNLRRNVPCLKTLILTGNGVRGWNVISDLGAGCPKLEFLSLVGNPVTSKSIYNAP